jgi:aerobic carbon-monoxide dehydrogenase medium subunit
MIPIQFDYARPRNLETAFQLLAENQTAQILAGGHSLLTAIKMGQISPSMLVDLSKIPELQDIKAGSEAERVLQIGAMSSYDQTANTIEIKANYHALAEAASSIGDAQIRNWGRIGDTFAYRDLACDLLASFLVLEATFHTVSSSGSRKILADRFIINSSKTSLEPGEILKLIGFPAYVAGTGSAYAHFKHPASNFTICGVAALIQQANDGTVSKCRVAITGTHTSAVRLHRVETALEGKIPTSKNITLASTQAVMDGNCQKLSNSNCSYASPEYRSYLISVLTEQVLTQAIARTGL